MLTKYTYNPRIGSTPPSPQYMEQGEIVVQVEGNPDEVGLYAKTSTDAVQHFPSKEYIQDAVVHATITSGNPHNVTKADVGLGNVDNTSDLNKPVSTAQKTYLQDNYVQNTDIVDNLTSNSTDKPLSAYQGQVLLNQIQSTLGGAAVDLTALKNRVSTCESSIEDCLDFINTNQGMFV